MKEVYILRHAEWNGKDDVLTEQGVSDAKNQAELLPRFERVYSSPFKRTQQTAETITGVKPHLEIAASVPQLALAIKEEVFMRRDTHPLGIAGALFEATRAHPALETAGHALYELIEQVLNDLQEDQKALIISHDGTMLAAERLLTKKNFNDLLEKTYAEFERFIVNERLELIKATRLTQN